MRVFNALFFAVLFFSSAAPAALSHEEFKKVMRAFHEAYDARLAERGEVLSLNEEASKLDFYGIAIVHASYVRLEAQGRPNHNLNIFGGLLRLPEIDQDAVALILCHELGHGIGGAPYKNQSMTDDLASVEGQADYFATRFCLREIFAHLAPAESSLEPAGSICEGGDEPCARGLRAIERFQIFQRDHSVRGGPSDLRQRDDFVASEIVTLPHFYPSPQCRVDTLVLGLLGQERPRCWFVP